jgi:hypothetical protein
MHPLPNQYKGKEYTAVLITWVPREGECNCHYSVYTANQRGVCGQGVTRPKAIDDLREKILERINSDIKEQLPVEFCVDIIPQMTNPFIESLIEQLSARVDVLRVDTIKLAPLD